MSNELNTIPDHILARMQGRVSSAIMEQAKSGLSSGDMVPRISLKGSRFRIKDGDAETVLDSTSIDVVIVGANTGMAKNYYAKAYDASAEATGPDCSSVDGIRPVADAPHPQSDTCAGCPMNVWGSKITPQGQKIKACSDSKRLAVVAADSVDGPVYMLTVTASVLKDFNTYLTQLARRGLAVEFVRTRLSFDSNASYPKLQFNMNGYLEAEQIDAVEKAATSEDARIATGATKAALPAPDVAAPKPMLVAPAAPAPAPAAPAPAAKGFGSKPVSVPKVEQKAEPSAASVLTNDALADEILSLIGGTSDDA
jgi:hypothetical protein